MNKEKQISIVCTLSVTIGLSKKPAINKSHNKYIISEKLVPN